MNHTPKLILPARLKYGILALLMLLFLCSRQAAAQSANTIYNISTTATSITATYCGQNSCVGNNDYSVVKWYRNGTKIIEQTIWLQYSEGFTTSYTYDCTDLVPGSQVNISVVCDHYYCVWPSPGQYIYTNTSATSSPTLAAYNPVSSVQATDGKYGDKVIVTWADQESFDNHAYKVYRNGTLVSGTLAAGTTTFTHYGAPVGPVGVYTVRGVVNGTELAAATGDNGHAFNINLQASQNYFNKVVLTWNDFSSTNAPTGYMITRSDGTTPIEIVNTSSIYATAFEDASVTLIPGYTYNYTIKTFPLGNNITGVASGKIKPNGVISGSVKTPTNIGVANVMVKAVLQGSALPSDTTRHYYAVTDINGDYTISGVYYYTGATFTVTPELDSRVFNPLSRSVSLNQMSPAATLVNFTDMSSFVVSGTITQGGCPMPGVTLLVDNIPQIGVTDSNGVYNLTVSSGGSYTIKPQLGDHQFSPAQRTEIITANANGIDFSDTTQRFIEGHFEASCHTWIGVAQIQVSSVGNSLPACFCDTLLTDVNGCFSAKLPARQYRLDLIGFTSFNEGVLPSAEIMVYFANSVDADLTNIDSSSFHGDTLTHDFTYRKPPQLSVAGIDDVHTCSGEILPVLQQRINYILDFTANESFEGINCPAGGGYVIITENISSNALAFNTDTLFYQQGDTMHYALKPGTPNIIAPYKKSFQAILYCDNLSDTVSYDVIVLGHRPRTQTFTTVTPQMPFHILHNPPGDASYAYLEQNSSISNSFTTSFLQEGSVNAYFMVHAGPDVSVSAGVGAEVETEIDITLDVGGNLGFGVSGLTTDAFTVTSTATDRFETSGSTDMIGRDGDVYVGGALNLIYALSDALLYDFDNCQIKDSIILMMQPDGIKTTFIYTESHIENIVMPELQYMIDYYNSVGDPDTAAYFQNQLHVWQQVIDSNTTNIDNAGFIANKSFSGGTLSDYSVSTTRATSHSLEMNYYLDYSVALDIGATVNGMGLSYGVSVAGRSTWGNVVASDNETSTTVGYVLSDDDLGDSYSVDILNDSIYGTPAFRLVAGRSSCPWEPGTLPREGVQMIANNTYQEAEEGTPAVFVLQLANTSESNETMTYDLSFDQTSNPNGATITIGGSPVVGSVSFPYTIPAGQSVNVTVTVSKGPLSSLYNGLKFTLSSGCDDQVSQDVFLSAMFYKTHTLTVATNGLGSTTPQLGANVYRENTNVYLYATPDAGWVFQKWVIGSQVYIDPSVSVSMTSNITATAYFTQTTATQYTMTVTCHGSGTSTPPAGVHYFNEGSTVNLNALPDLQNAFLKWEIDGVEINNAQTSVVMNQNTTVDVYFIGTKLVKIEVASGEGTTNPAEGFNTVNLSDTLSLFASPAMGYLFTKWVVGGNEYFTQSLDVNILQDTIIKVYFDTTSQQQFQVIVSNIGNGTTTPPMGVHHFVSGSTVTLTAYPANGQVFEKWMIDGVSYTDNPNTVSITDNTMIDAYFALNTAGVHELYTHSYPISVYPNPSGGMLFIESADPLRYIEVYEQTGRLVKTESCEKMTSLSLDLSHLLNGNYILRIYSANETKTMKIVLLR